MYYSQQQKSKSIYSGARMNTELNLDIIVEQTRTSFLSKKKNGVCTKI